MPDGSIDNGVTRAYVQNMNLKLPTELNPVTETEVPDVGKVITQRNFDREKYNQAKVDHANQRRIIREVFRNDLKEEYLLDNMVACEEIIFAEAWDRGHSCGFESVQGHYSDLVDFTHKILRATDKKVLDTLGL